MVLLRGASGILTLAVAAAFGMWLAGVGTTIAQSGTPISVLEISLWPEYDDPRVLVILAGSLEEEAGILVLPLPAGADLNAVAYLGEDGPLTNAEWEVDRSDGGMALTVQLPAAGFQVEYYLDAVQPGDETFISVVIPAPGASVAEARLEVQQPAQATSLSGDPALGEPRLGFGGLTYLSRRLGSVESGDMIRQEVRYIRLAPGLSAPPRAAVAAPAPTPSSGGGPDLRLVAIGAIAAGGLALVSALWLRTGRRLPPVLERRRSPREASARYCHNCGHHFEPSDRYCANCGAPRRS